MANWDNIPSCVRPYFVKKICIMGPESTGKSVLAARLAKHYGTVYVSEYARGLIDLLDNTFTQDDIHYIARARSPRKRPWPAGQSFVDLRHRPDHHHHLERYFFQGLPVLDQEEADRREYDLYLLTDIDVPWVDDPQRYLPKDRKAFLNRCKRELESRNRPYMVISETGKKDTPKPA